MYAGLVDLVGAARVEVPWTQPRPVADLLGSVGVPRCELGLLLVDGDCVTTDHRLTGGERLAAFPPLRRLSPDADCTVWASPPEPRRFVLDVHLGTLARRLRLLGFDTWYRTDAQDQELVDIAVRDHRILLSRDRQLLLRRAIVHGYCPRSDDPEQQLAEVADRYDLAERQAPLTRCVRCNGRLVAASKHEVFEDLPERTRGAFDTFARCGDCHRVYWPGAHTPAIGRILSRVAHGDARQRAQVRPRPGGGTAPAGG